MESTLEPHSGPPIGWNVTQDHQPRPLALRVILHKREYVLPWSRLLFAEEANGELLISFATHEILINGYGLIHLLADLAAHRVLCLYEPLRADRFRTVNEPEPKGGIHQISVRRVEEE
jgi:hypothetical protein